MAGRTSVKVPLEIIIASAKYVGDAPKPEFCNVPGCARVTRCMSLCHAHYHYWQKWKAGQPRVNPNWEEVKKYALPPTTNHRFKAKNRHCHVPGCLRDYEARGLCVLHYKRLMKGIEIEKLDSK